MPLEDFTTSMVNLTDAGLRDVRTRDDVGPAVEAVLCEVERPRTNLGNSGPPGRAD